MPKDVLHRTSLIPQVWQHEHFPRWSHQRSLVAHVWQHQHLRGSPSNSSLSLRAPADAQQPVPVLVLGAPRGDGCAGGVPLRLRILLPPLEHDTHTA
jgi:hypothetical protein